MGQLLFDLGLFKARYYLAFINTFVRVDSTHCYLGKNYLLTIVWNFDYLLTTFWNFDYLLGLWTTWGVHKLRSRDDGSSCSAWQSLLKGTVCRYIHLLEAMMHVNLNTCFVSSFQIVSEVSASLLLMGPKKRLVVSLPTSCWTITMMYRRQFYNKLGGWSAGYLVLSATNYPFWRIYQDSFDYIRQDDSILIGVISSQASFCCL